MRDLTPRLPRKAPLFAQQSSIYSPEATLEEDYTDLPQPSFTKIMKLNLPEWWLILIGSIGAIFSGLLWPLLGLLVGFLLDAIVNTSEEVLGKIQLPASLTIALGVISGVGYFVRVSEVHAHYMYICMISVYPHLIFSSAFDYIPYLEWLHYSTV